MKLLSKIVVGLAVSLIIAAAWAQEDIPGSKDHPLFTRMPNFYISDYEEKDFDTQDFYNLQGKPITVEGHKYVITYKLKEGAQPLTDIQIIRNYTNAIKRIGGGCLEERYQAYMKLEKKGQEIWASVYPGSYGDSYKLNIVEKAEMVQEVVANADVFAKDISQTGHTTVYGLYFDTAKSELKPESEPTLKEIARLLQEKPKLKLYVVGHTDNVGELSYNMKLSQDRAEAVVNALVSQYSAAAARLSARGVGPLVPVASNKTEDGRAQNRRVELVER